MSRPDVPFEVLERRILEGDPSQIPATLWGLTEAQRKPLAPPTYKLYRRLFSGSLSATGQRLANAALAVVGTSPLEKAKRVNVWTFGDYHRATREALIALFRDRKPTWAGRWLNHQLAGESMLSWEVIDALVELESDLDMEHENFVRHMGSQLGLKNRTEEFLARPYLHPVVWRLFEFPSPAFAVESDKISEYQPGYESWSAVFLKLTADGTLSRERTLDETLTALTRDFPQNQQSGLIKLHQRMKPNRSEIQAREAGYRELLSVPTSRVVNFALKFLKKLEQPDVGAFLNAALPALELPTKGSAMTILKLAWSWAEPLPERKAALTEILQRACSHPHRDVVEEAARLLGELPGFEPPAQEDPPLPEPAPPEVDLSGVDPRWLALLGMDTEAAAEPLNYRLVDVPYRATPVEPLSTLQELIDAIAAAVEQCDSADEVELILDGLSRLADQRPPDFAVRTEALKKRIQDYQIGESVTGLISGYGMAWVTRFLLLSWLEGRLVPTPKLTYERNFGLYLFLRARLEELRTRLVAGQPRPMLAAPTHQGGWIEPSTLVERCQACAPGEAPADLIAALLRLAPWGRSKALKRASSLAGVEGRALRWALGGDEPPGKRDKPCWLWLAAARARDPYRDWSELLGFPAAAAQPHWHLNSKNRIRWEGLPSVDSPGKVRAMVGALFGRRSVSHELNPTLLCYQQSGQTWEMTDTRSRWGILWWASVWPARLDQFWVLASRCLVDRLDMTGSTIYPNHIYLEPLFEQDRPWDDNSILVLWLGLLSKDSDLRATAIDALIEGVEDGRAHPTPLGRVLARMDQQGQLKLNRLTEALSEVARTGPLACWTVARTLDPLLGSPLPKAGHHLLELYLDTTEYLPEAVRSALQQVEGKSKTARLAARLCELPCDPPNPLRIRNLLLEARMERAQSWTSSSTL